MLLALLVALAPPVEHERLGDRHYRLSLPAAAADSRAVLASTAQALCGDLDPAFGSFRVAGPALEQELFCLEPGEGDVRAAILARTYAWFAAKDSGRYQEAWVSLSDSLKAASPLPEWKAVAERFNQSAGPVRARQVTRLTLYENPPGAPEQGLYIAADFSADFERLDFVCGYLMWRRNSAGEWRLVREEQNIVDRRTAENLTEIDRPCLKLANGLATAMSARVSRSSTSHPLSGNTASI